MAKRKYDVAILIQRRETVVVQLSSLAMQSVRASLVVQLVQRGELFCGAAPNSALNPDFLCAICRNRDPLGLSGKNRIMGTN